MDLDNRHGEILVYMTPQENINSKSNTVVIACKRMIRQGGSKRRRFHCLVRNVSSSLNNVTDDVGVHEHVKGMFTLFQHTKYGIPVEAPKTKLQLVQTRLDSSCCSTWLGTNTVIFITFRTVKTWFFPPLNNNWGCIRAHESMASHIVEPSFIMERDLLRGRRMKMGEVSPGNIICKPNNGLVVSAIQRSPLDTRLTWISSEV